MHQILDFLNSHGSCRQFSDRLVDSQAEQTIITTAQRSPTSSNVQAYSIVSVRDQNTKDRLSVLAGKQQHVATSGLFLVFCADLHRLKSLCDSRGYAFTGDHTEQFIIATVDASLVAGRALMAAQALGLGGVMVGGIRNNPDEVAGLLNLPEYVYAVMGMSLGWPVKTPAVKPRLPIDAVRYSEKYDSAQSVEAISEYDCTIDELGYLKGREVEPETYPDFDGTYSWAEHTARRMASTKKGTLRPHMLSHLQSRGFLKK